jgi:tRNA dimethylallyltransferase
MQHEQTHLGDGVPPKQGGRVRGAVIVVAGPTASGKSGLALSLAREFSGTIVNADSMQLYEELPVLTAQPTPAEQREVPHRLYGVLRADTPASAGKWRPMAIAAIEEALAAGRLPIVVGGTGLYLRSLMQGLSPIPDIPARVREEAERLWAEWGPQQFRELLAERDPQIVARLEANDRQRHIRAYEVVSATGTPLSEWQKLPAEGPPPGLAFCTIVLLPPRQGLRQAIATRFAAMLEAGALEEVRAAARTQPGRSLLQRVLGGTALADHLAGKTPLDQAVNLAVTATNQYAKRQHTWLRHQIIADLLFEKQLSEQNLPEILSFIRQLRLTA